MDLCPDFFLRDTFLSIVSLLASTSLSSLVVYKLYRALHQSEVEVRTSLVVQGNQTVGSKRTLFNGQAVNKEGLNGNVTNGKIPRVSNIEIVDHVDFRKESLEDVAEVCQQEEDSERSYMEESDLDLSIEMEDADFHEEDIHYTTEEKVESNEDFSIGKSFEEEEEKEVNFSSAIADNNPSDDLYERIIETVVGFIDQVPSLESSDSFACFVIVNTLDFSIQVVSFSSKPSTELVTNKNSNQINPKGFNSGTGWKKIKISRISLNDTRPVVIARRTFVKFLYEDLFGLNRESHHKSNIDINSNYTGFNRNSYPLSYNSVKGKEKSSETENFIIEQCPDGNGYQLKEGLQVFLVVNKAQVDEMEAERKLRKAEKRENIATDKTLLYEKLIQWSCLGVQGSILAHLIKPIYINAILVPSNSKAKKLHSKLTSCQDQLEDMFDTLLNQSPAVTDVGFKYNPPNIIGLRVSSDIFTKSSAELRPQSTKSCSSTGSNGFSQREICFSVIGGHKSHESTIEQIFTDTGCTKFGHSSKLSKSSLFDEFGRLTFYQKSISKVSWSKFRPVYPLNYAAVKRIAVPYRVIKSNLIQDGIGRSKEGSNSDNFNAFDPK